MIVFSFIVVFLEAKPNLSVSKSDVVSENFVKFTINEGSEMFRLKNFLKTFFRINI